MAKLYFNYAAMNAGKSTTLLQSAFNYRERGMNVMMFTAAIDDRAKAGEISSRIGLSSEAFVFDSDTDIYALVERAHHGGPLACVFLDEAQFLSAMQVTQLARIVDHLSIPVICYGLRTDFQGNLFTGSARLMALADEIRELKTICHCGRKATMNLRITEDGRAVREGQSIEIGGNERYTPLCRLHFFNAMEEAD